MTCDDTRPSHGRIDFEGLPNTRDLGGLPAADGRRVRRGLLLRSGTLYFATSADCRRLIEDYHLRAVVDLRGEDELAEYPDGMSMSLHYHIDTQWEPGERYYEDLSEVEDSLTELTMDLTLGETERTIDLLAVLRGEAPV